MDFGDTGGSFFRWDAATAVTVAVDIFEIGLNTTSLYRVGGVSAYQTTDLGDAQHEVIGFSWVYGNTTSGSGGAAPVETNTGNTKLSITTTSLESRNTTAASGGTPTAHVAHGWNVLQPLDLWYPNGLEPVVFGDGGGGELNVMRMLAAPADSITMYWQVFVRGGNVI